MLEFAYPWLLALTIAAPLIVWLHFRQRRNAIAWPGAAELNLLADRRSGIVKSVLLMAALLSGIIALAGPRIAQAGSHIESEGIAILLAVDVSGSVAENDFDWNGEKISRLDAIKRAFESYVKARPQDRLGLVLFAALPETACPLTRDHAALTKMLSTAEPRGVPTESETNVGDALAWSVARLRHETGIKSILICSDGEHNVGPPALTPRQAAQLAASAAIRVDTLFAGPSEAGRKSLQSVAATTGGAAFQANNADDLKRVCDELNRLSRNRQDDPRRLKYWEVYPWMSLFAALFLTASLAYSRGPGRIVP